MATERTDFGDLSVAKSPDVFSVQMNGLIVKLESGMVEEYSNRDIFSLAACLRLADADYENSRESNDDFLEKFYEFSQKQSDARFSFRVVSLLLNEVVGLDYDEDLEKKPGEENGREMSDKLQDFCIDVIEKRLVELKDRPAELKQVAYEVGSVLARIETPAWGYPEVNIPEALVERLRTIMERPEIKSGHEQSMGENIQKAREEISE